MNFFQGHTFDHLLGQGFCCYEV